MQKKSLLFQERSSTLWYKRILYILVLPVIVVGCVGENNEIRPLYQQNISPELQDIYIQTIDSKQGVFIRNLLQTRMRYAHNPRYRLQVTFNISKTDLAIARDNSVARQQLRANIQFILYQLKTANTDFKQIYQFTVFGTANFSTSSGPYISSVSERDAERRALTIAVENGILRLASYFYQP